jgi:hypothetical protein
MGRSVPKRWAQVDFSVLDCSVSSEDRGLGGLPLGVVASAKLISISTFVERSSLELPPRLSVLPECLRQGVPPRPQIGAFARMGLHRKFVAQFP